MKPNFLKVVTVIMVMVLVATAMAFAGTVGKKPVINVTLENVNLGDKGGTGTIGVHHGSSKNYEYGTVNYSWSRSFNEDALQSAAVKKQIDEIGRAYTGSNLDSVTNELVSATLIPGGYSYYINGQSSSAFDPFDVAGIRERVVAGRDYRIEYTVSKSLRSFTINTDDNSLFDIRVTVKGAYNTYNITGDSYISPIVLDLDGDGMLSASNGEWLPHPKKVDRDNMRVFDVNGNGFNCMVEWVGSSDGLLVEPKADGTVDGSCLFGTTGGYDNGFEKLALRDKNRDGKISQEELAGLFVWQDSNRNAKVDKGELNTVQSLGITVISCNFNQGFVSYFVQDHEMKKMWDWWPNYAELMKMKS